MESRLALLLVDLSVMLLLEMLKLFLLPATFKVSTPKSPENDLRLEAALQLKLSLPVVPTAVLAALLNEVSFTIT